jgi:hypothetical protein
MTSKIIPRLSTDGIQRPDQLWLVTFVDDARQEVVAQAKLMTGDYSHPFILTFLGCCSFGTHLILACPYRALYHI